MAAHVDLGKFLEEKQIKPAEAARQLGVSRAALHVWLHGTQRPRHEWRLKIAKWTRGRVPVDAWTTEEERASIADIGAARVPAKAGAA